jgi:hypothetical protein
MAIRARHAGTVLRSDARWPTLCNQLPHRPPSGVAGGTVKVMKGAVFCNVVEQTGKHAASISLSLRTPHCLPKNAAVQRSRIARTSSDLHQTDGPLPLSVIRMFHSFPKTPNGPRASRHRPFRTESPDGGKSTPTRASHDLPGQVFS